MPKAFWGAALGTLAVSAGLAADMRFEISYPASANAGPLTGRIFVMITRTLTPETAGRGAGRGGDREPRLQIGRLGVPFFGRDFEKLAPGATVVIDASDLGTPVESLSAIPPGDYYVQALVNLYTEFHRSDEMGEHIMAHMPAGTVADWWKQ